MHTNKTELQVKIGIKNNPMPCYHGNIGQQTADKLKKKIFGKANWTKLEVWNIKTEYTR